MKSTWLLFAGLLTCSSIAVAHQEPIESRWCEGGRVTLLGTFTLHGNQLSRYASWATETGECPATTDISTRSCGQFDDEYDMARSASASMCQQLVYRSGPGDNGTVRPIFYEPASFRDQDPNHHELYRLEQGIVFACGLCELPRSADEKQLELVK
ncbi:hypothetical protein [Shewanella sp. GXUN23E]|uniref:hypothetical protein n=1 Tax=Shewanella sp. GXUN23E TaxID=3422498 RepID=UPI003D7D7F38